MLDMFLKRAGFSRGYFLDSGTGNGEQFHGEFCKGAHPANAVVKKFLFGKGFYDPAGKAAVPLPMFQ
ncbi:hypothetical protein GCM10011312_07290 [Planktosalinus lacus]|uniref:Uncharacterized protein n=1 Tax=Planktosalinus lacus TaxID=1526573 RepID=A0A8J2Y5J9_9FLAO|nr:hypothetical protein GCM10011312_07290 [Planktosalinus lacus]